VFLLVSLVLFLAFTSFDEPLRNAAQQVKLKQQQQQQQQQQTPQQHLTTSPPSKKDSK
jgi:hypothetical protein